MLTSLTDSLRIAKSLARALTAQHRKTTELRNELANPKTPFTKYDPIQRKLKVESDKEEKIEKKLNYIYKKIKAEKKKQQLR